MSTLIRAGTVVTGRSVLRPGWLEIEGGTITAVAAGPAPREPDTDHGPDAVIVPGFVDIHVHGGGGSAYTATDPEEIRAAAAFHRAHGTTSTLASLVTAGDATLLRSVAVLAELAQDGVIAGIHLEGPWLSPARRGAHQPSLLRDPDPVLLDRLAAAAQGHLRMVTLAPELPGGLDLVRRITGAGAVAAIGHTDATFAQTRAAADAGARVATHLFNAMPPIGHREPGPVLALLEDDRITLELIADGVHQDPAILELVRRAAGPQRIALVTDAMAAAGMPDGDWTLGPLDVVVAQGVARTVADGSIAGGTSTMDRLFAGAMAGAPGGWLDAVTMTSSAPARALGLPAGLLEPGRAAEYVVLDAGLEVQAVHSRFS